MRKRAIRFITGAFTVVALSAAGVGGVALAQSGSSPSGTPVPPVIAPAAEAPRVIALNFYADWCPGCKALKPQLDEVIAGAASQPVLFVKLDQTDKASRQAEYTLAALGLGELWRAHAGKTGYVLLVNTQTRRVVGMLRGGLDTNALKATLASALSM